MDKYDVKRLTLALSIQAEIEGMKAANQQNQYDNFSAAYKEFDFWLKSDELRTLANKRNNQL